jgi:predicted metal-dependent enzyme (double-stranded beta helix superfamily)
VFTGYHFVLPVRNIKIVHFYKREMSITSISTLVKEIDQVIDPYKLENSIPVIERYEGDDWTSFSLENKARYSKIKVPLALVNKDFEIFVITWKQGQSSPIHDHAEFGCVLKVLKGNLTAYRYSEALTLTTTTQLSEGTVAFMKNEMGVHRVENTGDETAVSMHVYAPSNHQAKVFLAVM